MQLGVHADMESMQPVLIQRYQCHAASRLLNDGAPGNNRGLPLSTVARYPATRGQL